MSTECSLTRKTFRLFSPVKRAIQSVIQVDSHINYLSYSMIAYACPETSDRAFAALVQIEGLRAEVADAKGQGQMSNKPELIAAAEALDAILRRTAGDFHTPQSPMFKVMIGADRLYVKSGYPLKNIPSDVNGFPVEVTATVTDHVVRH